MGRKESNQTNQQKIIPSNHLYLEAKISFTAISKQIDLY